MLVPVVRKKFVTKLQKDLQAMYLSWNWYFIKQRIFLSSLLVTFNYLLNISTRSFLNNFRLFFTISNDSIRLGNYIECEFLHFVVARNIKISIHNCALIAFISRNDTRITLLKVCIYMLRLLQINHVSRT